MGTDFETISSKLLEQIEEFLTRHNTFVEKGNKSAGRDARKALGEIKKLTTEYRRLSVLNCK